MCALHGVERVGGNIADLLKRGHARLLEHLVGELVREDQKVAGFCPVVGRRIGYLLLTLKRGGEANRQARPEWNDTYWQHWAGITHVWLGGGLVSGAW